MTRLRARVAERLKGAQNTYAMLTTFNEIDMTNIMKLRADFKVRIRGWRLLTGDVVACVT
jgi:pyruvate/2-oxoglutarate dehydrogenase complex dihydrolipoamide acyltransferase (E2) component